MSVSGTNTFSQIRNDIINRAFSILGVKTRERALTSEEVNEASVKAASSIEEVEAITWQN